MRRFEQTIARDGPAWVNDEDSLRKAGSKSDPYVRFKAMLESGEPPNSFAELVRTSREMDTRSPEQRPGKEKK